MFDLKARLKKTRDGFVSPLKKVFQRGTKLTLEDYEAVEELLIGSDMGVEACDRIMDALKSEKNIDDYHSFLRKEFSELLAEGDDNDPADSATPRALLIIGINGVGKTTSIAKLANHFKGQGKSVILAAGDTFRAAAAEQLGTWAERSGTEFVRGADGGDPSSVIYDAVERASSKNIELVLADTAGRLHTKTNLMEELKKVRRVAEKGAGTVTETLLVIDATTGQNGLAQAREFRDATDVTGVVLTKLDGSAKGGIVFAIETELGIPVKLVGIGEQIDDLVPFEPHEFLAALFETD